MHDSISHVGPPPESGLLSAVVAEPAVAIPRRGPAVESTAAPGQTVSRARRAAAVAFQAAACACVPVLVLLLLDDIDGTLLVGFLFGAVWCGAIHLAHSSSWLSPLALGARTTVARGALATLPALAVLSGWVPAGPTAGEFVLMSAATVFWAVAFWPLGGGPREPKRVLVVGSEGGGRELARELDDDEALPFACAGLIVDTPARTNGSSANGDRARANGSNGSGAPTNGSSGGGVMALSTDHAATGTVADLAEVVRDGRPDLVVIAGADRDRAMAGVLDAGSARVRVLGVADFYEHAYGRVPVEHVAPGWFMSILHLYRRPYPRFVKRVVDLTFASALLLLTAPLFPVVAFLVARSGPGPVLFRQIRVGEGGHPFEILKFRTMIRDAEVPGRAVWASRGDARVTRVGRILRKSRIDELPQLWNVLRGEMSFVGPRPERPEFVSLLEQTVPHWSRRHLVKPGITGWAQVRLGYTADAVTATDKLSYDLYYLKHQGLLLDLAIVARTVGTVFSGAGAH